jgi:hypothetical protein
MHSALQSGGAAQGDWQRALRFRAQKGAQDHVRIGLPGNGGCSVPQRQRPASECRQSAMPRHDDSASHALIETDRLGSAWRQDAAEAEGLHQASPLHGTGPRCSRCGTSRPWASIGCSSAGAAGNAPGMTSAVASLKGSCRGSRARSLCHVETVEARGPHLARRAGAPPQTAYRQCGEEVRPKVGASQAKPVPRACRRSPLIVARAAPSWPSAASTKASATRWPAYRHRLLARLMAATGRTRARRSGDYHGNGGATA